MTEKSKIDITIKLLRENLNRASKRIEACREARRDDAYELLADAETIVGRVRKELNELELTEVTTTMMRDRIVPPFLDRRGCWKLFDRELRTKPIGPHKPGEDVIPGRPR